MKILKRIISFSTIIVAIIYGIIMYFKGTTDLYQYMVLSLLILIATTSLIMDIQYKEKFEVFFKRMDSLMDSSSIESLESVDLCAQELMHMVRKGNHIVDFVSIDTEVRTKNQKENHLMHMAVQSLFQNKNIKLTYITMLRNDTVARFISNISLGNLHSNGNMYAYFDSGNAIPFATFLVVDNKYVITRSPYEVGQDASYIIIRNEVLAKHYKNWVSFIWKSAKKIESADDIDTIYERIKDSIPVDQKKTIEQYVEIIKERMVKEG